MLVVDVTDDHFQHVLDGDQPGHAAVFVDHDRHVRLGGAELAQQAVEALALRHEHHRAQRLLQVEIVGRQEVAQQVLAQQDALHVVLVLADHREARMAGLDHVRQQLFHRFGQADHVHLAALHHHLAHGALGEGQHAFDHRQRFGIQHIALEGGMQLGNQLFAVFRFVGKAVEQALEPVGRGFTGIIVHGVGSGFLCGVRIGIA
ncbi:hypothetical protein D3C85_1174650 [compost metagenome]